MTGSPSVETSVGNSHEFGYCQRVTAVRTEKILESCSENPRGVGIPLGRRWPWPVEAGLLAWEFGSVPVVRKQSRSRVSGFEFDVKSKALETLDQIASVLLRFQCVKIVRTEVLIGDRGLEHVVDDHEERMADCDQGSFFSAARRQSSVQRSQVTVLGAAGSPGRFNQGTAQPGVAFRVA